MNLALRMIEEPNGTYDFIQLFVNNAAEVDAWVHKAIALLNEEAVFWITYPKQSSKVKTDINRDILWKLMDEKTDYRAVSNVAVDDKWSALRFRHKSKVKTNILKINHWRPFIMENQLKAHYRILSKHLSSMHRFKKFGML